MDFKNSCDSFNNFIKNKNTILDNYKLLTYSYEIFKQMFDSVNAHKNRLSDLIHITSNKSDVNNDILNMLDNSVEQLLNELGVYIKSTFCYSSGLEKKIILPVLDNNEYQNHEQHFFSQYGYNDHDIILNSITLEPSICLSIFNDEKEVIVRYNFKNDVYQDLCFPLLWSGHLIYFDTLRSASNEPNNTINVAVSSDDFVDKLSREIKNINGLSDIFLFELTKFNNNITRLKEQTSFDI